MSAFAAEADAGPNTGVSASSHNQTHATPDETKVPAWRVAAIGG